MLGGAAVDGATVATGTAAIGEEATKEGEGDDDAKRKMGGDDQKMDS